MKSTLRFMVSTLSVSVACILLLVIFTTPQQFVSSYAQSAEMEMTNMNQSISPSEQIISEGAVSRDAVHIFTSEIESVDENRLKISGDTFTQRTIAATKGQNITVYFYNLDDVKTERHSFTIDPYKVNVDLGFGEIGKTTFTANKTGIFKYYCKYHPIVMTGQLIVLP